MKALQDQIGKSGQRFVILYLWKKKMGLERIRAYMNQSLGPGAYSKAQFVRWVQHFEQGDFYARTN
jgi:hypothetical protein